MNQTVNIQTQESPLAQEAKTLLEQFLHEGARSMLQAAIEFEVENYIDQHKALRDEQGHRLVVRNGHQPPRPILTPLGILPVVPPRVNDRREGFKFTSAILPPYLRRTPSIDALVPALYLKGLSTTEFPEALSAILGPGAAGLSAANIVRLKAVWEEDYKKWSRRDLTGKRYVYLWADGIYFNVRLGEDERSCILVIMGALPNGTKELLAVWDGHRESKLSWTEVLSDLKRRGMSEAPLLAIGDGALGFWSALREVFSQTREQRCWVHKTANVLDLLPKKLQPHAKQAIHQIYLAATRKDALEAFDAFLDLYEAKYPKVGECLRKDKDELLAFYDFPAEHWQHLRTTNPIESTFATVRLRTRRTKGCGSTTATLTMVFKLATEAEKHWRRLNGSQRIAEIIDGVKFVDGVRKEAKAA
jgi:putative transposase